MKLNGLVLIAVAALVGALGAGAVVGATAPSSEGPTEVSLASDKAQVSANRGKRGKRGPRGFRGPRGSQGSQGPQGSPGLAGVTIVQSAEIDVPSGMSAYEVNPDGLVARCPAGKVVIGTGFNGGEDWWSVSNYGPFVGGFFVNKSPITFTNVQVEATCASVGASTTSRSVISNQLAKWQADMSRFQKRFQALD